MIRSSVGQWNFNAGQAMTEFVVSVAFVFLVLFVIVPTFGKIMDIQFQNLQASRYVAWERTVWLEGTGKHEHELFAISSAEFESVAVRNSSSVINSMHNRFFNEQGRNLPTLITEEDTNASGGIASPIWTYVQSKNPMYQGTTVESLDEDDTPGVAYAVLKGVNSGLKLITKPINFLLGETGHFLHLDFNKEGYYAPVVRTHLNKGNSHGSGTGIWGREGGVWGNGIESSIFQVWDGVFTSRAGILADGWSVQSESQYKNMANNLVLSSVFDNVVLNTIIDVAGKLELGLEGKAIDKLSFGAVGIEPMPAVDGVPVDVTCDGGFCSYAE